MVQKPEIDFNTILIEEMQLFLFTPKSIEVVLKFSEQSKRNIVHQLRAKRYKAEKDAQRKIRKEVHDSKPRR